MRSATITALLACADAHGSIIGPESPYQMTKGTANFGHHWYSQGSQIGCAKSSGANCNAETPCCENPMKATLKSVGQLSFSILTDAGKSNFTGFLKHLNSKRSLRGLLAVEAAKKSADDTEALTPPFATNKHRFNPWFAPGHAPVANPCGILGGWRFNSASDYIAGPGGGLADYKAGRGGPTNIEMPDPAMAPAAGSTGSMIIRQAVDVRMQKAQGKNYSTNDNKRWKAGSDVEVSYTLKANHGGGVQWRICPLENLLDGGDFDESCFSKTPLEYVGDTSWFKFKNSTTGEVASIPFKANRVSDANTDGVLPAGSTWSKVGLPACSGAGGGSGAGSDSPCDKPQFENELTAAGIWGYSNSDSGGSPAFKKVMNEYSLVDKVMVPEGLEGDYVLQWRWDSEQTAQVWTQCSIVTIGE